jgi:competence/damage-inducible protein CinA-like protein
MGLKSAVICIGDELLIGQVVNTNASYLCAKLLEIGIPAEKVITVSDNQINIIKEFRLTFPKFDVTVVTGGLGPTHDDITKTCISKYFKSKLVLDKKVLKHVNYIFKRRKMPMPETNIEQALMPGISIALENTGTAPGILIDKNGKVFCAMPGVPHEMRYIMENSLQPYLLKKFGSRKDKRVIVQKTLHTIGISESLLFEKAGNIEEITLNKPNFRTSLAFLPTNYETRLRVMVEADNVKIANKELSSAVEKLKERVGKYIYSYDESSLPKVIGVILRKKKLTLAIAESCTGGLITSKITDIPGSSDYFLDSVISYSNESKKKFIGVKDSTLRKHGAVSRQTAIEMAEGVRKRSGADIGISTTGIAGPAGGTKTKPVGLIWIGYSDKSLSFAKDFYFTKDRLRNKEVMSKMALEVLRRKLLKIKS